MATANQNYGEVNRPDYTALIVDLNNFARFPTLAVGLIVAALRQSRIAVEVISPLKLDAPPFEREHQENWLGALKRHANHQVSPMLLGLRDYARHIYKKRKNRPNSGVLAAVAECLRKKPDVILLSAYLQHRQYVDAIGQMAKSSGIPLLLGGPVFNMPEVAKAWLNVPGLSAIVGSEAELQLPDMIHTLCSGHDMLKFPGCTLPDGRSSGTAPPLRDLDRVPIPDFDDFPWDKYPLRAIPIMTGRGCQWAKCKFCSDVVTASGRTFRTRSLTKVLDEMELQAERYKTQNFLFLDLKLNSDPAMLVGLAQNVRKRVPDAYWIGSVHVDQRKNNGLGQPELQAAFEGGMRRVSFGLETGSQRLLDEMEKGSTVERYSRFLQEGHAAGLSLRCTMFKGYPTETARDLLATADFLERHEKLLDRVHFNDFSVIEDTPIYEELRKSPARFPDFHITKWDHTNALARYRSRKGADPDYARANARVLHVVNAINRRPLRPEATFLDGMM